MRLRATVKTAEAFATFDRWESAIRDVALPIALNKLGDQARTAGVRAMRDVYGIGVRDISPYLRVSPARNGRLEWVLEAAGIGFPLSLFKPRQTKAGVTVRVKGRRFLIPHAFFKAIRGNAQVWARGTYNAAAGGGPGTAGPRAGKRRKRGIREATGRSAFERTGERFGRFAFGRHRLPITLLRTFSPPSALQNENVEDAMNRRIEEQAPAVISAAIKFATGAR